MIATVLQFPTKKIKIAFGQDQIIGNNNLR